MSTANRKPHVYTQFQHREFDRSAVALPAIVRWGGQEYGARVLDLAPGGAMIECSASLAPAKTFLLRCGSIAADAIVVWEKTGRYGVNFRLPLSQEQVTEQLSRHDAIKCRKLRKGCPDTPTNGSSTPVNLQQMRDADYDPALRAHLLDIEAAHHEVQAWLAVLETITTGELFDLGQLNSARLRLRQANSARTHVALLASRHLVTVQPADLGLRELQRSEFEVSRMISKHVQRWTIQMLQDDWGGYCHATKKVLESVRGLIAAEKKVLCPMLRGERVQE